MKNLLVFVCLFSFSIFGIAQSTLTPTSSIRVFGEIEKETTITLESLMEMKSEVIADQLIYNHKGEVKDTLSNMKGLSLK